MRRSTGLILTSLAAGLLASTALAQESAVPSPVPGQAPGASILGLNATAAGRGVDMKGPFANRGGDLPPIIGSLQSDGIKFVALGDDGGVKAYLGEAANGRFQAFHVTPDGEHVVAGLLFSSGGDNVTGRQVARMLKRFNEAAAAVPGVDADALKAVPDETPPSAAPDVPFLEWLQSSGMKITPFLEREGGLDGALVETPSKDGKPGKMQAFYVFPGGRHAVAGILIKKGGVFVTGLQIAALQQRYLTSVEANAQEKASAVAVGTANPPAAPKEIAVPDAAPVPPTASASATTTAAPASPAPSAEIPRPVQPPSVPKPTAPSGPISAKPAEAADKYLVNASDQKDFVEAVKTTVWFPVGVRTAPSVWMVADPQCPFCHDTWRRLKPLVFDGKLQVRVILIAGLRGSDPLVRSILSRGSPVGSEAGRAWLEGEGSIANAPIKPPPADGTPTNEDAKRFVALNGAFAQRFQISRTPFLFYTGKESKLYASVGNPEDMDAFLAGVR